MEPAPQLPTHDAQGIFSQRQRRLILWIVLGCVLVLVFWLLAASEYKLSEFTRTFLSPKSVEFITQLFLSVFVAVLGAIVYSAFENRQYIATLSRIYAVGPAELVDEAIGLLDRYRRARVYDYHVEYTLLGTDTPGLLALVVKFSYRKLLADRDLHFRVIRLKTPDDRLTFERNRAAVDALYAKSELFYFFPEAELREQFGHDKVEALFGFQYLRIAGNKIEPAFIPTDPGTLHARVPEGHEMSEPVLLEYCFQFAVPASDIHFCLTEFPTRGVEIRFTRDSSLRGSISVEAYEMMSATTGNATVAEDTPGTHLVSHSGWILPKSGAVFHWYPSD